MNIIYNTNIVMLIFIFNLSKYKIEGMVYDWMVMAKH